MIKNRIKQLRVELNLTQQELAKKAKVTRQTINAIEQSKYLPTLALVFTLSEIFKKNIEDIFYRE